jgi:thiol peroxidase
MADISLQGAPIHTSGELPPNETAAPDFTLTRGDLADVSLADFAGKKKLFNIVPSLDTPVCALSTKKFNDYAKQHPDAVTLIVSADLPFAQKRFCDAEKLGNVVPLAMFRDKKFAEDYGVLIEDGPMAGLTARAIVIADANDKVRYGEIVSEIGDEPDYQAALAALDAC